MVDQAGGGSPGAESGADPGADLTIAVGDNGIGIEPQFHTTIFQIFRRLHTREEFDGTGVGLAVCNKIVQAHDGRIWVESELRRGATFFILLPGRPPASTTTLSVSSTVSMNDHKPMFYQVPSDEPNAS